MPKQRLPENIIMQGNVQESPSNNTDLTKLDPFSRDKASMRGIGLRYRYALIMNKAECEGLMCQASDKTLNNNGVKPRWTNQHSPYNGRII